MFLGSEMASSIKFGLHTEIYNFQFSEGDSEKKKHLFFKKYSDGLFLCDHHFTFVIFMARISDGKSIKNKKFTSVFHEI